VPSPPAIDWNDEIAHWLLTTLSNTGARYTCAKVSAVWKSASAVEPSPIQPLAMRVSPLIALAIAQPTAWMNCVARLPEIEKNPRRLNEYMTGSCRPLSGSRSLDRSWQIISTSGASSCARSRLCCRYVGKFMSPGSSAISWAQPMASSPRLCM
jgi:hypothetical protein